MLSSDDFEARAEKARMHDHGATWRAYRRLRLLPSTFDRAVTKRARKRARRLRERRST